MTIDAKRISFTIQKIGKEFGIIVRFETHKFIVFKGSLSMVRGKFIHFVNHREALVPYVEYYFNQYVSA